MELTEARCIVCGHRSSRAPFEPDIAKRACAACGDIDMQLILRCGHCGRSGRATVSAGCRWCAERYVQVALDAAGRPLLFELRDAPGTYCRLCGRRWSDPAPGLDGDCQVCRLNDEPLPVWAADLARTEALYQRSRAAALARGATETDLRRAEARASWAHQHPDAQPAGWLTRREQDS